MPGADTAIKMGHNTPLDSKPSHSKEMHDSPVGSAPDPKEAQGLTSKLTPAWTVTNYFITINGCDLRMEDVLDLEIMFGGSTIPAILTIQDSDAHLTGENGKVPIAVGGSVHIEYDSIGNCHYEDDFTITKVNFATDDRNRKLVVILMEDTDTVKSKSSYISKGYPGKTHSEVIQEHRKEIGTKKELIVAEPEHQKQKKQNVVIPAHQNNHDTIEKMNEHNGYDIVKDKEKHYLVHKEQKTFDKLKFNREIFEYDIANPFSVHRILQFNFKGFDLDKMLKAIPARTSTQNHQGEVNANKEKDGVKAEPKAKGKNLSNSGTIGGTEVGKAIKFKGERQADVNQSNENQTFNILQNLGEGSIWVPGMNKDRVGYKIQIVFPKPIGYEQVGDSDQYTTEWEVYAVRDKLIKTYFVQELFVRNPGKTS